jgi:hypothetical protein
MMLICPIALYLTYYSFDLSLCNRFSRPVVERESIHHLSVLEEI